MRKGSKPLLRRIVSLTLCLAMLTTMVPSLPWSPVETAQALESDNPTLTETKTIIWYVEEAPVDDILGYKVTMEIDGKKLARTFHQNTSPTTENVKIGVYEFPIKYSAIVLSGPGGHAHELWVTIADNSKNFQRINSISALFSSKVGPFESKITRTVTTTYNNPSTLGTVIRGYEDAGKINWKGNDWWLLEKGMEYTGDSGYDYYYEGYDTSFDTNRGGEAKATIYYDVPDDGRKATEVTYDFGPKRSKITFDPGTDGILTGAAYDYFVQTDTYGSERSGSQVPAVTPILGKTFIGWSKDGGQTVYSADELSAQTIGEEDVTWSAQYRNTKYKIVFNKNDSAAQGEMAPQTMTYGEASVLNENQFTLANKVFGGWNLAPDGRGTSFDDEEDINARGVIGVSIPLSDGTEYNLYAQWNAIQYHKVHFYPNGGTFNGTKDPTLYRTTTADLNSRNYVEYPDKSKFTALANAPTRPGYTFMGWYDEITGGNKIYNEDGSLHVSGRDLEIDNDTALFAQWTADSMTIGDIEDQTYDGTQKQPALQVRVSGNLLTAGTDYITIWENNINASGTTSNPGKAVAKVYGINDYAGINQTKEFNILKADQVITFAPVDGGSADISYGESFENTASAKYDSQNVAITYSLVGDGDSDEAQLDTATGKVTPLKGGVSITVQAASTATDNVKEATKEYTLNIAKAVPELYFANEEISAKGGETITNTLTINAKDAADSSALIGNVKYTIKSQTPDGVVASGGISGDGTKTVSINAGTVLGDAVIKASLEENDKYEAASVEFTLHMVSESDIQYRAKGYSGTYDGQGHQITITPVNPADGSLKVYYSIEDIGADDSGWSETHPLITDVSDASETLKNGSREVYFKLVAKGYKTVTGSARVEIRPAELTEASFQLSEGEERTAYAYTGEGVEPVIEQVKAGDLIALKDDTHQDYDVTYHNNVEVTGENSKAYAKITGKGNYTGTIMKTFDILPNLWIMLDLNDGTGSSPVKVEGVAGEAVPYTAPQRDGYMFAGWSRESGTEAAGDMNPQFTDELNQKTLYAVWKKQADKELYTVTFVIDETIEQFAAAPSYTFLTTNEQGKLGSQVLPQVKRIGENADRYQFIGWLTPDGRRIGEDTVFTENTEVKPSWQYTDPLKKNPPYTITFDGNNGTVIGDTTVETDDMGKLSESKFSKAERENYTFDGWFTASSGGISTDSATKFYEDTTLYAHWTYDGEGPSEDKKPPFNITFNANGGTLTGGDEAAVPQETVTVATDGSGKLSKLPEPVSAGGKTFDGWYTGMNDGYKISVDTIFHEDTEVYARWFDVHNITFNPNGGTFADLEGYTVDEGMVKIATGSSGKLTEAIPEVSRRGYIFVGWFTDKNGSIDRNTQFAEDMTVRAVWDTDPDADKKFAVTFDANGGKLSGTGTLITDKNGTLTGQQLPEATRANHNFEGWYYDGNPVTESTVFTADSVVYAKWTGTGGGGGGGVLDVQRPIIEAGEGVTVSLNPDGTVASITVKEGYELDDVILNGASKGKVTTVSGLKTGDRLTVNGRKIGEQTSGSTGGIGLMSRYKLIARSSYAVSPKGKQAILIKWRDRNGLELNFDGVEIFRSTKRFSGFGKKPIFDTSLGRYYNTDIEGGVKYYYKVRGYIKIGGVKYYTDWSLKAFRIAKTKSTK